MAHMADLPPLIMTRNSSETSRGLDSSLPTPDDELPLSTYNREYRTTKRQALFYPGPGAKIVEEPSRISPGVNSLLDPTDSYFPTIDSQDKIIPSSSSDAALLVRRRSTKALINRYESFSPTSIARSSVASSTAVSSSPHSCHLQPPISPARLQSDLPALPDSPPSFSPSPSGRSPISLNRPSARPPIKDSFRSILSVFGKKRDPLDVYSRRYQSPERAALSDDSLMDPQGEILKQGPLLHLRTFGASPIWTKTTSIVTPTHITIMLASADSSRILPLAACLDIRSLSTSEIEERVMKGDVFAEGTYAFEMKFEKEGMEQFAAYSVTDRGAWVSTLWDAVLLARGSASEDRTEDLIDEPRAITTDDSATPPTALDYKEILHYETRPASDSIDPTISRRLAIYEPPVIVPDGTMEHVDYSTVEAKELEPSSLPTTPKSAPRIEHALTEANVSSISANLTPITQIQASEELKTITEITEQDTFSEVFSLTTPTLDRRDPDPESPSVQSGLTRLQYMDDSPEGIHAPLETGPGLNTSVTASTSRTQWTSDSQDYSDAARNIGEHVVGLLPSEINTPTPYQDQVEPRENGSFQESSVVLASLRGVEQKLDGVHDFLRASEPGLGNTAMASLHDLLKETNAHVKALRQEINNLRPMTTMANLAPARPESESSLSPAIAQQLQDFKKALAAHHLPVDALGEALDDVRDDVRATLVDITANIGKMAGDQNSDAVMQKLDELILAQRPTTNEANSTDMANKLDQLLALCAQGNSGLASNDLAPGPLVNQEETESSSLAKIFELIKDDKVAQEAQRQQQADSVRYLNELNTWLESFTNRGLATIQSTAAGVESLVKQLNPEAPPDALPGSMNNIAPSSTPAGLLENIRHCVAELRQQQQERQTMDETIQVLVQNITEDMQERRANNVASIPAMFEHQSRQQEIVLRTFAEELSKEIRGERMRFIDAMKDATTINVQIHVEEFKQELSREVMASTQEVARLQRQRQDLEQQLSELFALLARQKRAAFEHETQPHRQIPPHNHPRAGHR
ncbi:hypothetical protein SISNIDRAFT_546592 [Sistotremastrum niveocremeum HHB9708]|uniref:PH domain-containing protein n=1 Tax=Sistotremastrum niveocremeum HHB9708 TaxID=1314777 RepID=A0A165AA58_9AGAM|nr:hypothetical protein SISNIDRAFT_546592 [Sistotremastrum niveocremeum HHB9708]